MDKKITKFDNLFLTLIQGFTQSQIEIAKIIVLRTLYYLLRNISSNAQNFRFFLKQQIGLAIPE